MRENPFEGNILVAEKHDVWPDVSKDTTMIAGRLTLFSEMLLE
jgi:hypothetical protein